jgi:hypothetical protein
VWSSRRGVFVLSKSDYCNFVLELFDFSQQQSARDRHYVAVGTCIDSARDREGYLASWLPDSTVYLEQRLGSGDMHPDGVVPKVQAPHAPVHAQRLAEAGAHRVVHANALQVLRARAGGGGVIIVLQYHYCNFMNKKSAY